MYKYPAILFFIFLLQYPSKGQEELLDFAKKSYHLDTAIKYGELYYQYTLSQENSDEQFKALCFLISKYNTVGLYERAEKYLELAHKIALKSKDKNKIAEVHMRRADMEKAKDNFAESLENYLKAEILFKEEKNYTWLTRCYVGISEFYRKFGDFENAIKYIDLGFQTIKNVDPIDGELEIKLYNRAAAIHNEHDVKKDVSISLSRKAIQLSKKANDRFHLAVSYNEIGFSFKNTGFNDSAEIYYKMAEENWMEVGAYLNAMHAMNNRAMLYAHNGFPREKVTQLYYEIIEKVKSYNIPYNLRDVYLYLCFEEVKANDYKAAYHYFTLFHDEELKKLKNEYDVNVVNITERYENEKIKSEVESVNRELKIKNEGLEKVQDEKNMLALMLYVLLGFVFIIILLLLRINSSNKKLKNKNEEKDVLLKEVHHRVKNNLQVITSILELQSFKSSDSETKEVLNECRDRINSMSLVHKRLYQRDDLAHLSFSEFLNDLILALQQSYHSNSGVEFKITGAENIIFDVDTSIPLGLILNELITNSFKHSNVLNKSLVISIHLEKKSDQSFCLEFKDNGVGLPSTILVEQTSTLGLTLIRNLVKQLGGNITYQFENGAKFSILFLDTAQRKQKD